MSPLLREVGVIGSFRRGPSQRYKDQGYDLDANGVVQINGPVVQPGIQWKIEAVSVYSNSALASTMFLFLDAVDYTNVLDFTSLGNNDISDRNSPILIPQGSMFVANWTGLTAAAATVCTITVQYYIEELLYSEVQ